MSVCLPYTEIKNLRLAVNKNECYFLGTDKQNTENVRLYIEGVVLPNQMKDVYLQHFSNGEPQPFYCATYTWQYRQLTIEGKKIKSVCV